MIKRWAFSVVSFFYSLKDENLQWQVTNQEQLLKLKHERALAEKALEIELKNKSVQLAHEISLLETKNETELIILKTQCKQDIKDYKQYLSSLDQLKQSIQLSYVHLPVAVAFTIHHHAKQLLNKMWDADDIEIKEVEKNPAPPLTEKAEKDLVDNKDESPKENQGKSTEKDQAN